MRRGVSKKSIERLSAMTPAERREAHRRREAYKYNGPMKSKKFRRKRSRHTWIQALAQDLMRHGGARAWKDPLRWKVKQDYKSRWREEEENQKAERLIAHFDFDAELGQDKPFVKDAARRRKKTLRHKMIQEGW